MLDRQAFSYLKKKRVAQTISDSGLCTIQDSVRRDLNPIRDFAFLRNQSNKTANNIHVQEQFSRNIVEGLMPNSGYFRRMNRCETTSETTLETKATKMK